MDIATLPQNKDGFKCILLVGGVFAKFIDATPLRNQQADTISSELWKQWITLHGCPSYLQTRVPMWMVRISGRCVRNSLSKHVDPLHTTRREMVLLEETSELSAKYYVPYC